MPLVLQVAVPLLLVAWQVAGRDRSMVGWLIKTTVVLLYLTAAHVAGLWVLLPRYSVGLFAVGSGVAALSQLPTIQRLPWHSGRSSWRSIAVRTAIAAIAVSVLGTAAAGRQLPSGEVVDLEFPLRNGTYYVVGGGSGELLNPHLRTLTAERFRAYRGQSYGLDLLKIGAYGLRATGLLPADPTWYAIYGDPVYAPCSGVVVHAQDGAPDMPPPQPDRTRMAGNHVLLDCGGVHVLLAHLRPGSVRVQPLQSVACDTMLGLVGNSGNSNEPHLHIHAQRPAGAHGEPLSGDPLPIRFDGRYLVRNDRIDTRVAP